MREKNGCFSYLKKCLLIFSFLRFRKKVHHFKKDIDEKTLFKHLFCLMDARKTFLFEECHMSYHSLCCVNFSFKLPCFVFYCIYLVTFLSFVLLHFVPLSIVISFLIDHFRLVLCTFQFPFSLLRLVHSRPYIAHFSILFLFYTHFSILSFL